MILSGYFSSMIVFNNKKIIVLIIKNSCFKRHNAWLLKQYNFSHIHFYSLITKMTFQGFVSALEENAHFDYELIKDTEC